MIEQLQESYSLTLLCQVFQIYRRNFHAWRKRSAILSAQKVHELSVVHAIHKEGNESAGACTVSTIVTE